MWELVDAEGEIYCVYGSIKKTTIGYLISMPFILRFDTALKK